MISQDENIINIRLAVQYQVQNPRAYFFSVADPDVTLRQVIESAERAVIGKSTMDFVLTEGRGQTADDIKTATQNVLDRYGIGVHVSNANLVDAQPPDEVQSAFEDAIKAREDEQRLKNEAEAYRNEIVPKARGAKSRLLEESEAYKHRAISEADGETGRFRELLTEYEKAPDITRQRIYMDTMQEVINQTTVFLVDVNNESKVLHLPFDRLQRQVTTSKLTREVEKPSASSQDVLGANKGSLSRSAVYRGREGRVQ